MRTKIVSFGARIFRNTNILENNSSIKKKSSNNFSSPKRVVSLNSSSESDVSEVDRKNRKRNWKQEREVNYSITDLENTLNNFHDIGAYKIET